LSEECELKKSYEAGEKEGVHGFKGKRQIGKEVEQMKKIISLVLAAAMMLVVVGCGGGDQAKKDGSGSGAKGDKQITMGFSQIGAESEWRTANTESIKQAAKDAGVNLQFSDAQQKQENQIKAIRSFIAQGVDIIAFVPIVETGWDTVLKEAKDAKIPVIVVDRDVKVSDDSLYVAKIGTDSVAEGKKVFQWIDEYMAKNNKKPRSGDKFNIVELEGTVGSSVAIRRQEGFKDAMAASQNAGKYNLLASQTGEFTRQKGQEVMESFLKSDRDKIDILFAQNDDMALGAIQAIEAAGLKPGKDITIISIDGVKGIFQAMIEGKSNCTVECNPLQGPLLMETAKKILNGEKVEKLVYVDEGIFPADVAEKTLPERKY
jgi:simple sugar transport system substrate-binding protein